MVAWTDVWVSTGGLAARVCMAEEHKDRQGGGSERRLRATLSYPKMQS